MKNLIAIILLAMLVAACSSNQTKEGDSVASAHDGSPKTKRVCETVRTNETGARMKRVCKDVVVKEN